MLPTASFFLVHETVGMDVYSAVVFSLTLITCTVKYLSVDLGDVSFGLSLAACCVSMVHMLLVNFSAVHGFVCLTFQLAGLLAVCGAVMTLVLPVQVTDRDTYPPALYCLFVAVVVSFIGFVHASVHLTDDQKHGDV